jgi:hypothetical protein
LWYGSTVFVDDNDFALTHGNYPGGFDWIIGHIFYVSFQNDARPYGPRTVIGTTLTPSGRVPAKPLDVTTSRQVGSGSPFFCILAAKRFNFAAAASAWALLSLISTAP